MEKVLYEELFPDEFAERIKNACRIFTSWYIRVAWTSYAIRSRRNTVKGIIYRACRENGRGGPSNAICRAGSRVR